MAGDMRVRLLLELVNKLSGPARQAAADIKGVGAAAMSLQGTATGKLQQVLQQTSAAAKGAAASLTGAGAAARTVGQSGATLPLQQALAGVTDQARRADGALDGVAAAARSISPSGAGRPLQQALAGAAEQARRADGALDGVAAAARGIGAEDARRLSRVLAGIPTAGARSAEAMAALAREAGRVASVGPGQALRRDLAEIAREARRSRDALSAAVNGGRALAQELAKIPGAGSHSAEALAAITREAGRLSRVGPGQSLRRDLAQVAREARRTHDTLTELTRGVQRLERRTTGQPLRRDLALIAREARRADDALHGVGAKAQRLQQANVGSAMQRGLANIATEAERARKALAATNAEAGRAGRRGPLIAPAAQPEAAAVPGSASAADGDGTSILATGKNMLLMGGAAYAGREVVRRTVGASVSFDSAMADIKKKVDLPEGRDWSDIEREIDRAAMTYGRSRAEVAAMVANLGASGVGFEDLPEYTEMAIRTGVSWDMAANEASAELMRARAGLGWTEEQLRDYGDKVNALGDASNALERDIAEMFGRASGGAAAAGVSTDVTLAGLTALNSVGVQPEIASRFFSQFSAKLAMASSDPEKWKAAGLDGNAVTKGMQTDSFKTMIDVLDQIASKANAAELAVDIFGEGWWDEAMRLRRAIPEWKRMMDLLNDPSRWKGSQQAALNVELATTQNHLNRLLATAEKVGDALGRWTLPHINVGADSIVQWIDSLGSRATVLDAFMERLRALKALANGEDISGGVKPDDPSKPKEGFMDWASKWEGDAVKWLSGGASEQKYLGNYLDELAFGKEGGKEQRLLEARLQAWRDHQQKLDAELDRLIAAEREARDKLARLQSEREQARKMGIDTNVIDYQIARAERDLDGKSAAADTGRADQRDRRQKVADDVFEANQALANVRRDIEVTQRRQLFRTSKDLGGGLPPAKLTRDLPDSDRLKADGLPAVVGGFDATASGPHAGVRAGYAEKPAPRIPTRGWRISKDEAGGFEMPSFPPPPQRAPLQLDLPATAPIILPQRPEAPKFGFGPEGFARQPEQYGPAGSPAPVSMRAIALQEMISPPDIGATIMDRLAADIEAGRPKVEGSAQAVGDSLRSALFGTDLAPAGQAAMDTYAAGIAANGGRAVAAARAVSAQVQSALRVDMSGAVSSGGSAPRGRIGGSLHDIPTGGP